MNRKQELQELIDNFDKSEHVSEAQYDDFLDECNEMVIIGGLTYYPSKVLESVDPIAYRCGFDDYVDSVELESIDAYNELVEELEGLEE